MPAAPTFSIIIPTYNSEATIRECIKSILNQAHSSFEILIMDGLSKDDTIKICESFGDSRILTYSEKDKGIYDAMNKGIDKARGKWLYFLGSDDSFFKDDVLEKIEIEIDEHPKSKMIYGSVYTSGNYVQKYEAFTFEKLLELNICHQAIFYHFSLFEDKRYDLKFEICADWDLNLKVFNKKDCPLSVAIIIANYNLEGASGDWRRHPDYINNFQNLNKVLRYKNFPYFTYLYSIKKMKSIVSFISKLTKWTFRS